MFALTLPSDFLQFNVGQIVILFATLFAWGMTWQRSKSRGEANTERINESKGQLVELQRRVTILEADNSKVAVIANDIRWMKRTMRMRWNMSEDDGGDNDS